jgi:hypothetical protein
MGTADSRWQTVQRFDFASGEVKSHTRTGIGGLVAKANLTRTGILEYRAADGSVRRELRHPDDVFDSDSLDSLAHAPVTDDHPGKVDTGNWRGESIGHVAGRPERSPETTASGDQMVRGEIHIQHGPAVDKADSGALKEASCGYSCQLDPTPGEYRGQRYDGRQRNIRYNHVALGPPGWGRAGPEVSLRLDSASAGADFRVSANRLDENSRHETQHWKEVTKMGTDRRQESGVTAVGAAEGTDIVESSRKAMDKKKLDASKGPTRKQRARMQDGRGNSTGAFGTYNSPEAVAAARERDNGPDAVARGRAQNNFPSTPDELSAEDARAAMVKKKVDAWKSPGRRDRDRIRDGRRPIGT